MVGNLTFHTQSLAHLESLPWSRAYLFQSTLVVSHTNWTALCFFFTHKLLFRWFFIRHCRNGGVHEQTSLNAWQHKRHIPILCLGFSPLLLTIGHRYTRLNSCHLKVLLIVTSFVSHQF
jgi:hypothetical protein